MKKKRARPSGVTAVYTAGFVAKMDRRLRAARIVREKLQQLVTDLGDDLSYQERSLCERVVHIEALLMQQEDALRAGKPIDQPAYVQCINTLVGLLRTLGTKRRPKHVKRLHELVSEARKP